MENRTSFDLNEAIRRWQQRLGTAPGFCADTLEELTLHLRASTQRIMEAGLSEEESFLIACRRLGGPDELKFEFGKLNCGLIWQTRVFWMLAGMFVYLAGANVATLISATVMALCGRFLTNGFLLGWIGVAACVSVIVGARILFRLVAAGRLTRITSVLSQRRRIALCVLFCGVIGLKTAANSAESVFYHGLSPGPLGQALVITGWLNSIGGIVMILLIVVALTRPVFWRNAAAGGFFTILLLVACGLNFFATGCGKAPAPVAGGPTALEQVMASWKTEEDAAVEKFLEINWSRRPLFSTGTILNYSEPQFVSIPVSARDQMSEQLTADLATLKAICRAVNTKGKEAQAKGDKATAEKCFGQLKRCGKALEEPDSLLILQMVGKAINKTGATQLAALNK